MDERNMKKPNRVGAAFVIAAALAGVQRATAAEIPDVKGGKDHPLVSRYAGSVMLGYRFREFDEFVIPLAPLKIVGGERNPAKELRVGGAATRIVYLIPEGRSTLEVVSNYERELLGAGFQLLYTCTGHLHCRDLMQFLYDSRGPLKYGKGGTFDFAQSAFSGHIQDPRYLALKRAGPEGETYVSLAVGVHETNIPPELHMRTIALLDVVVKAGMDTGKVIVDAASMAREMGQAGHVALYGILFDTDRAVVKPESEPALVEIAKLLKQDAALKLYVVGHTDNAGPFDHNMTLSDRRAAAVVQALTSRHGIAATRLRAVGVGPAAPVASNNKEEGRAKNRRVELVAQ